MLKLKRGDRHAVIMPINNIVWPYHVSRWRLTSASRAGRWSLPPDSSSRQHLIKRMACMTNGKWTKEWEYDKWDKSRLFVACETHTSIGTSWDPAAGTQDQSQNEHCHARRRDTQGEREHGHVDRGEGSIPARVCFVGSCWCRLSPLAALSNCGRGHRNDGWHRLIGSALSTSLIQVQLVGTQTVGIKGVGGRR